VDTDRDAESLGGGPDRVERERVEVAVQDVLRGDYPDVAELGDAPFQARRFPDVSMLALDAFGSYESTRQCFFIAEMAPNLVFDTSLSYNFDFIEDFARHFGAERVAFGTDLYSWPVGRRISHLLDQIVASDLSVEDKAAILGGNARRLYRLTAPTRERGPGSPNSSVR
jgi:Amidohydrolase